MLKNFISDSRNREFETSSDLESLDESDTESGSSEHKKSKKKVIIQPARRQSVMPVPGRNHYGSFYLRMGAVGKYRFPDNKFLVS